MNQSEFEATHPLLLIIKTVIGNSWNMSFSFRMCFVNFINTCMDVLHLDENELGHFRPGMCTSKQ